MSDPAYLVPPPAEVQVSGNVSAEVWQLPAAVWFAEPVEVEVDLAAAWGWLTSELEAHGSRLLAVSGAEQADQAAVRLVSICLDEIALDSAEGYELTVGSSGVQIAAAGQAGWFYGLATLCQWLRLQSSTGEVAGLRVRDEPDFAVRGAMLDISRNRVPKQQELLRLVDLLASLKINHLQLYTEHTFAYQGHEKVWRHASPMTAEQIRQLGSYCRQRQIELVPCQNSFGHLHRWLIHQPYRQLAECPDGIDHPFSEQPEPFGLCPTDPGSQDLLQDLYAQLLPNFAGDLFNVGLDETLDLGRCRSAELCQQRGTQQVYLDFLHRVYLMARSHGRRILFWGDIILQRPDLIAQLPEDAIALAWGYEADHPFAKECLDFAAAEREFWVCPGTSSWNSFMGRASNALENLASAAIHGRKYGAGGYLITDWGDRGHLQPLPASYLGWTAGAAFSWRVSAAEEVDAERVDAWLDYHVLRDEKRVLARLLRQLGDVHSLSGPQPINGSTLFYSVMMATLPAAERRGEGMTIEGLAAARRAIEELLAQLPDAAPRRDDAELLRAEIRWSGDMLCFGCDLASRRLEIGEDTPLCELPEEQRRGLERRLGELTATLESLWAKRSRPGGLSESVARLHAVAALLGESGKAV